MGQLQDTLPRPTLRAGTKAASAGPRRVCMCKFKNSANSQREKLPSLSDRSTGTQLGSSRRDAAHRHLMPKAHHSPRSYLEHQELVYQTLSFSSSRLLTVEHRRAQTKSQIQAVCIGLKIIHQGLKGDGLTGCIDG